MNQLQEIIRIVKQAVGNEPLYFDKAVQVKINGMFNALHIWAVQVSPQDELYVMDCEEQWEIIENIPVDLLVAHYIYERLKTIPKYKNIVVCQS